MKSRVHLYTHKEPNGRAYIVAEKSGLLALARALQQAANGALGLETIQLYSSDGHPYELVITTATEEEWQQSQLPYKKDSDPSQLNLVKLYDDTKKEISNNVSTN
jgi:hypothetical protein